MNTPITTRRALQTDNKRGLLAATRPGSALIRLLLALSGAGLLAGFFMRWMTVGDLLSVSGFGLMITAGDAATLLSGTNRWLLIVVPLFGALLMFGAFNGRRFVLWAALLAGLAVLGFGFYSALRLFLETTGLGMWIVVASAFVAFCVSLVGLGRSSR